MKTIKFITISILLLINTQSILGQQKTPLQSKNLDAFVGTWEYKTATETFQIVFIKGKATTVSFSYDCLIGGYLYIKNGVTIGDYTKNLLTEYNDKTREQITIFGTNAKENPANITPNSIWFIFRDRKLNKSTSGFYIRSNNFTLLSPTEARFQLFEDEGDYFDSESVPPVGFSVPTNVVMKKIDPIPPMPDPNAPPIGTPKKPVSAP